MCCSCEAHNLTIIGERFVAFLKKETKNETEQNPTEQYWDKTKVGSKIACRDGGSV